MKPETTEDILELMGGYVVAAALGTAMELGVFWLLAEKLLPATDVAQTLNIPLNRCHHWLQILCRLGLLEDTTEGYAPSIIVREAILTVQSQDTWAFQAREERDSSLFVQEMPFHITDLGFWAVIAQALSRRSLAFDTRRRKQRSTAA